MASEKHTFTKPFSRVKNDLAELQRWFPAFIKNDGIGGLSVDPVLFRSTFGPNTPEDDGTGLNDEANTPGVRVEAINDDGTDVAGTEPTIQILRSGSFDPRCRITHADGTITEFCLVAPSSERKDNSTALGTLTTGRALDIENFTDTSGPYPVFMTLQEFVEMIDTYRHVGESDADKPSWLPHGLIGRTVSAASANPAITDDPRVDSANDDPFPTTSPYRATVFMPMLLDNNQLSKECTGNSMHISVLNEAAGGGFDSTALTRYNADPINQAASVKYKIVGKSGDHVLGPQFAGNRKLQPDPTVRAKYANNDQSSDSTASIGPKYRTRMALACFLKDGTYSLNDGVLIPYTYDSSRYIGGTVSSTVYAVWDGDNGYGSDGDSTAEGTFVGSGYGQYENDRSAQIYPLFDFVQGPLCPAGQGANFDFSVVEGTFKKWSDLQTTWAEDEQPRSELVRPNPKRAPIRAVAVENAPSGSQGRHLVVWIEYPDPFIEPASAYQIDEGTTMVYLSGMTGDAGTGATDTDEWEAGDEAGYGVSYNAGTRDMNGWWCVNEVTDIGSTDLNTITTDYPAATMAYLQKLTIWVQGTRTTESAYKPGDNAWIAQGILSGSLSIQNPFFDESTGVGIGTLAAGVDQPGFSPAPQIANSKITAPGRIVHAYLDNKVEGSFTNPSRYALRDLRILSASDSQFASSPTRSNVGGGVLRIPPPLGWGLAATYLTRFSTSVSGSIINEVDEFLSLDEGALPTQWASKGLWTPIWSSIDHVTGNHAWDYTKPVGVSGTWTYGRNRPWPAHERCGTRLGYGGSLSANETTDYGTMEVACSPVALDLEVRAVIPDVQDRLFIMEFDTGGTHPRFGRHAMLNKDAHADYGSGFLTTWDGAGVMDRANNTGTVGIALGYLTTLNQQYPTHSSDRAVVYHFKDSGFMDADQWNNADSWPVDGFTSGFGMLGNATGKAATIGGGMQTIRTFFNEAGQTLVVNGSVQGTDANAPSTVWGLTINVADLISLTEEADLQSRSSEKPDKVARQSRHDDLQIDALTMRQIPSPSMLPFTVDTTEVDISGIARYTSLVVEADNISTATGMNVTASIHEVGTTSTIAGEAGAVVSGFEDIDLVFVGGIGTADLTGLPSSIVSNGFQVRFNFYVPDTTQTSLHPINWNATPIIRSWTIEYDIAPTASVACVSNTFNGDLSSPIDTKVGHILSFRGTGTTTDSDRTISQVKFDFGDGTVTDFINFADQTLTTATYDISHAYITSGTYSVTVTVKDDSGNVSAASSALSVVVAATNPVAVLRGLPALVRAGTAIRFTGADSYSPEAGVTLTDYEFSFGDGSSNVSGSSSSTTHTYAAAGEYQATLVVTDSNTNTSNTGSVVVKVLPATLVVPLTLNTKPSSFQRRRSSTLSISPILDAIYPEVSDTGSRSDEFVLQGQFLKETANADIDFMEELLQSGALVEFEWESVNYAGTPTGKTFVGRMTSFDYQRAGGQHGQTPYSATFIREAGLGA